MQNPANGTKGKKPVMVTKRIIEIEIGGGLVIVVLMLVIALGIFRGCGLL